MKRFLRKFIPVRQSEELKTLLARAEELAKSYAHDYVGVEHAFLCLRDLPPDHSLRSIIAQFPFDIAGFWEDLEREARVVTGRPVPSLLPYTPRLQQVLRIAIRTTKFSGESRVTLAHFLEQLRAKEIVWLRMFFDATSRIKKLTAVITRRRLHILRF